MRTSAVPDRILTPPPIRLPASLQPEMRLLIGNWLETRRIGLADAGKLMQAESFRAYANHGAAIDRSTYSLKLVFAGLGKLYEGAKFTEKAFAILDHLVENDLGPFGLGRLMQRANSLIRNNIRPIGIPALLVECFEAARS